MTILLFLTIGLTLVVVWLWDLVSQLRLRVDEINSRLHRDAESFDAEFDKLHDDIDDLVKLTYKYKQVKSYGKKK